MKKIIAGLSILLLTGCSAESPTSGYVEQQPKVTKTVQNPAIDWDKHPSSLKQIIDEEKAEKDCRALQEMFDIWVDVDARVGSYIHNSMDSAGCYD